MSQNRISVGVARPQGTVRAVGSSGMGVGQASGGGTQTLQRTYNPITTFNPQRTASSSLLQNTYNPQQQRQQTQANRVANARSAGEDQAAAIIAAINANNPVPNLPSFNSSAQRAQAQQKAAKTVNPVYQGFLNNYLGESNVRKQSERAARAGNKEQLMIDLQRALEDSGIRRDNVGEDTMNQLGDSTAEEDFLQQSEGREFDRARTALLGDVADAGLTESGIGQGVVQDAVTDRNIQSEEQGRQFEAQRRDIETFKTRTFGDLDLQDTRKQQDTSRGKAEQDRMLNEFMMMETEKEKQFRAQNEQERTQAVNAASQDAYAKTVSNKAAELARSGVAARDIDYFLRVYG